MPSLGLDVLNGPSPSLNILAGSSIIETKYGSSKEIAANLLVSFAYTSLISQIISSPFFSLAIFTLIALTQNNVY